MPKRFIAIGAMLLLGAAFSQAQSPGTTYPSQKIIYTDSVTNKTVWRMTVDGAQSGATNQLRDASGAEANSWSPDGTRICYTKTGHPTKPNGYYVMEVQTGVETFVAPGFEQVTFSGVDNTRYGGCEFSKTSNELYYFYYFKGTGSTDSWLEVRAVNLSSYAVRALKRFPQANFCAGGLIQNVDGTYIAVAMCTRPGTSRVQHDVILRPDGSELAGWGFDPASPDAAPFSFNYWHPSNPKVLRAYRNYTIGVWNIDTVTKVTPLPALIHVQGTPPNPPNSHACWTMDGSTFFFGGGHQAAHPLDVAPGTGANSRVGYDSGAYIYVATINQITANYPSIPSTYRVARHFTNQSAIELGDDAHYGHPHPHFSPNGSYLLFQSNCLVTSQGAPPGGAGDSPLTVDLFIVPYGTPPPPAGSQNFEIENLNFTTSSGDTITTYADSAASAGNYDIFTGNAVTDYVSYTAEVTMAGTYDVSVVGRTWSNRAITKLLIDGAQVGTTWDQYGTSVTWPVKNFGTKALSAGPHIFKFEITGKNASSTGYYLALDKLTLTGSVSVIVDNNNVGNSGGTLSSKTGTWTSSISSPGYNGTNYEHDGNTGKGMKTFTFTPNLPSPGNYNVYLQWTSGSNRASNVPVDVYHTSGTSTVLVNQQNNSGVWVLLGNYSFNAGTGYKAVIRTTSTNGFVIADAVKFEK